MTSFTELLRKAEESDQYWESGAQIDFSFKIANAMIEDNLNQTQLAEILGVSPPYVSKLLAGKQNVTLNTMIRYARRLGRILHLDLTKPGESNKAQQYSVKKSDGNEYAKIWIGENFSKEAQNDDFIGEFQLYSSNVELGLMESA